MIARRTRRATPRGARAWASSRSRSRSRGSFWTEEQHRPPLNARYPSLRPLIPPRAPRGPPFPELRAPQTRTRIKYSTTHWHYSVRPGGTRDSFERRSIGRGPIEDISAHV